MLRRSVALQIYEYDSLPMVRIFRIVVLLRNLHNFLYMYFIFIFILFLYVCYIVLFFDLVDVNFIIGKLMSFGVAKSNLSR